MATLDRYPLLEAYCNGKRVSYDVSSVFSSSNFGGPLEGKLFGDNENAALLHQIAFIAGSDRPDTPFGRDLPLLYGLLFSGCDVEYEVTAAGVHVERLWPDAPDQGWPYVDFPPILPYWHIAISGEAKCDWAEFSEDLLRVYEQQPSPLVMMMRPPVGVGVSLWGRSGDMEGVQIIWEVDIETNRVKTYNCCT